MRVTIRSVGWTLVGAACWLGGGALRAQPDGSTAPSTSDPPGASEPDADWPGLGDIDQLRPPPRPPPGWDEAKRERREHDAAGGLAESGPPVEDTPAEPATHERVEADPECRRACWRDGECILLDGQCRATSDWQCEHSQRCMREGRCTEVRGECVSTSSDDCLRSWMCVDTGACVVDLDGQRCVTQSSDRVHSGVLAGGIVATAVGGGVALCLGVPMLVFSDSGDDTHTAGAVTAVVGGLAVMAGIPMMIYGGRKKQPDDLGDLQATLVVGPSNASLRLSF